MNAIATPDCDPTAIEEVRLQTLQDLDLLDTPASESFDRITRMASQFLGAPVAAISLTDRKRQWFKSHAGTQEQEISRDGAPCAEVTRSADVLTIPDMLADHRFASCSLAQSGFRFYAGAPLIREGHVLGSMCLLDCKPRSFSPEEMNSLQDFATLVMTQIELQHNLGRIEQSSGLPNRHQFNEDVADQERKSPGEPRVAMLIDLADLCRANETISVLGSCYIEKLVRASSSTISKTLGGKEGLYHVGPTSFVLLFNEEERKPWWDLINVLREGLKKPVVYNSIPVPVEAAFGILPFRLCQSSPHDILRAVVHAAEDARKAEIDYAVYSQTSDEANRRRFLVLTEVRKAVEQQNEFALVYQPRMDLRTSICASAEALLRWKHPLLGNVSPAEFIPLVEQTAMARPVTQWVLGKALQQVATWCRDGIHVRVSINISARNLEEEHFSQSVESALAQFGVSPAAIEIEFTESALIRHRSRVLNQLEQLRAMGIELAIDDFGTGYSSFSYLRSLPATTLKLDRSFMPELAKSAKDQTLVQSIVSMAHNIGYRVVAEGVETAEVFSFLKECGCDEVQGYFVSRPLPVTAFEEFLRRGRDGQIRSVLTLLQQSVA